jgi:hypothetical protein
METKPITFEQLPYAVETLLAEVRELKIKLSQNEKTSIEKDRWLNIDELQAYMPNHPAKATIYGWVSNRLIPFHKGKKHLRFLASDIDKYLKQNKIKTVVEIQTDASNEVKQRFQKNK